ncbi:hypothetical protein Bphyt_1724 [Paraburkholderia phytofirmans PsJN]|uniref:Uncharacterized protein n=1 Tax=Paraburkholderia phytofirmans (strain DSM 17436 / LMG 22146 / PsJN) TaxID=398527 RepID=B2T3H1_PARPJ|nr:hypothetical protein Bphyt_1724 [Paraburkholderia phytofirmans PsJN]
MRTSSVVFRQVLSADAGWIRQIVSQRASSHHANSATQARLRRKLMAHQNMRRYKEETILQRDNPVRKFPNWRNGFEASNVS